jgi:hypothetical protein
VSIFSLLIFISDLDLRILEVVSERTQFKVNMELIFPTGPLTPLVELPPNTTPINIVYLPNFLDDEDDDDEETAIGHYILCGKLDSLIIAKQFCEHCNGIVLDNKTHRCPLRCPCCDGYCSGTRHHTSDRKTIPCNDCRLYFRSEQCFKIHKQRKTCQKRQLCPKCERIFKPSQKHEHCGEIKCLTCKEYYCEEEDEIHQCFMSTDIGKHRSLQPGEFKVFLDFGNCQRLYYFGTNNFWGIFAETFTHPKTGNHAVNHATIQTRCHKCEHISWTEGEKLDCCPVDRIVKFTGKTALKETVNHLFCNKRVKKSTIIAHGGGKEKRFIFFLTL